MVRNLVTRGALGRVWWALPALVIAGCNIAPVTTGSSNPPSNAIDYPQLELQVFAELNAARTNPPAYAANLTPLLSLFSGKTLRRPGWPTPILTNEGPSAVQEAVSFLASQPRVGALVLSSSLSKASRDLANDQSRTGATGHSSSNGASPTDRIARYGVWNGSYSENVDYAPVLGGRDVIEDMIIDDGVPDRGHRRNTFDASATVVGIGCAPHPKYGVVCVIDQAASFTPR